MFKLDVVYLRTPDGIHNNPGIELSSNNQTLMSDFKALVWEHEHFKLLNGFKQGDDRNWSYFEFWTENQTLVLEMAEQVAKQLGLNWDIR